MYLQYISFLHAEMTQLKSFLVYDKNLLYIVKYHGCCCPGNARSQDSSNHAIDYVEPI